MSLIAGRNTDNNKVSVLNVDDEGKLKIEPTELANIQLKLDNQYEYTYKNDLRYLRSEGKCFVASQRGYKANGAQSLTETQMSALYNPSGSGKKLFIYKIHATYRNEGNLNIQNRLILASFTETMTGGPDNPRTLKIGSGATSSALFRSNPGLNSSNTDKVVFLHSHDEPGNNTNIPYYTFDELIELPEGYGLQLRFEHSDDMEASKWNSAFYYIELDNTETYPTLPHIEPLAPP
jgi:hypothetical protein